ncbi:hypothetical protein C8Q80DRAFT_1203578 [Daedaleopsis nitida]|nr:hypothetical protein C8Q80DRAFT_1203578 [Daedaleopsis nitida]
MKPTTSSSSDRPGCSLVGCREYPKSRLDILEGHPEEEHSTVAAAQLCVSVTLLTLASIREHVPGPAIRVYMSDIGPSVEDDIRHRSPTDEEVYRCAGVTMEAGYGLRALPLTSKGYPPRFCASLFCQLAIVASPRRCLTPMEIIDAIEECFPPELVDRRDPIWRSRIMNALSRHAWFGALPCPSDVPDEDKAWFIDKRTYWPPHTKPFIPRRTAPHISYRVSQPRGSPFSRRPLKSVNPQVAHDRGGSTA